MAMSKRTVVHALYSWIDSDGVPKMALRGEEVELSGGELERAERLGAVTEDLLSGAATVPQPEPPVAAADAGKLLEEPAAKPTARAKPRES